MSVSSAEQFLTQLVNDSSFRQQFMDLKSADTVLQAAKDAGYDFTPDEMRSVLQNEKGIADFTDDQLDDLATAGAASWVGAGGAAAGAAVGAGAAGAACV
ncbi:MAG TPA: Nif11-like leader peptide family natural product precursor [Herpetosiphonaceae bacterium]